MKTLTDLIRELATIEQLPHIADHLPRLLLLKRAYAKEHGLSAVPTNTALLQVYREALTGGVLPRNTFIEQVLKKRGVRSQSWIAPIQVLTKPFRCPGKCIFCPNDASMPKSYINTEPGAMRALLNNFDPYKQVYNRLLSLYMTGHDTDKIEMIVLGGTWDVYPNDYKRDFLKGLYDACNTFDAFFSTVNFDQDMRATRYTMEELGIEYPATIEESMRINETATHRVIGLTIETRPEYMTDENCQMRRSRGVTRLEMGLQSMFDDVLDANKRGHSVQQARDAVHKMRQYGFKFSIHFMPGLYGSTIEKDIETFRLAFNDPWIKPDEIKFYPTSVIPNTELYDLYKKGEYTPLAHDDLIRVINDVQSQYIPPYTRIKRLIRDIPETEIVAGSKITNLRQLTDGWMQKKLSDDEEMRRGLYSRLYPHADVCWSLDELCRKLSTGGDVSDAISHEDGTIDTWIVGVQPNISSMRHFVSLDTRAREMRHRTEWEPQAAQMVVRRYHSSMGDEYFISFEDELGYIYGFTRLLVPTAGKTLEYPGLWAWTAMIRELHVYGQMAKIDAVKAVEVDLGDTDGEVIDDGQDPTFAIVPDTWPDELAEIDFAEDVEERKLQVEWILDESSVATHDTAQHKWFGSQLMAIAERITREAGMHRLTVISGVGVKEYYRKLGYSDEGTYVVKKIAS
jgi:ELP3 family radical SAM enzyme/protein acetyltransferase